MAEPQKPKLIVLLAFDEGEDGELGPAFEPREMQSEHKATYEAKQLAGKHAGVIAWTREVDPALGEYGEPAILFQAGKIPDME